MWVGERDYILKNPIDYDMKLVLYNLNVMEGQWIISYDFDFLNDYSGCLVENWSQAMKHEIRNQVGKLKL